ncbi:MAG: hypothetical protein WCK63_02010 [Betaproteobacteria bacterium]
MSYCVVDQVNGVIGSNFESLADAMVVIEEIMEEGKENEVNWLLELARATEDGGVVNMADEGFIHRILSVPPSEQHSVAIECAMERIYADCGIVGSAGD